MQRALRSILLLATLHATSALQALVLGGGFAGLYTALNLANGGVKTTLVDVRERFAFLPLLYDYACGAADADEISAPFEELCRVPNLTFKRAAVTSIDFDAKSATLDDGTRIDGETLVVALGREAPEAPANARPFYRLEDATFVRETLEGWDGAARDIVVVGGGYTGVELACNLKRKRPADDVTLWDRGDALVPNAAPGNQRRASRSHSASFSPKWFARPEKDAFRKRTSPRAAASRAVAAVGRSRRKTTSTPAPPPPLSLAEASRTPRIHVLRCACRSAACPSALSTPTTPNFRSWCAPAETEKASRSAALDAARLIDVFAPSFTYAGIRPEICA